MNEYDDILNRIVEEFYDTGKLKLSEGIESDVDNEDFGVETEEEIEIYDDENIPQKQKDYINKEYGELRNRDEIKKKLSDEFNMRSSNINTSSINKYVVRYIVSKEANRGNTDIFIEEKFEKFLDKVNRVLETNYENIKGFRELTSTRKPKKEGDLTDREILMNIFKMEPESIEYWLDLKRKNRDENWEKFKNKPISPKQYQERLNKLVNFLSTTDVIDLDFNMKTLLEEFNIPVTDVYLSEEIKDKYFNDIIKFFEGNTKVNFFIRFIFNKISENIESWGTFVKYSKGINEIITKNKIPDEEIKKGSNNVQKYMKSLKIYFNKIKEKGYCYIFSDDCELSSSDIEKVMDFFGKTYENSFLNKGFKKESKSVESRIHNLYKVGFNFSEKIKSDDFDVDDISDFIIENIENYLNQKDSITKYDLLADGDIKDSGGNVIIPKDGKVEVKDINQQDSYLSEFLASPVKKTEYEIRNNPTYLKRYNDVIGKVYRHLKKNWGDDIKEKIKKDLEGIIISNNIYVPNKNDNIEFYLSNVGRSNPEKQLRISVRYHINKNNWRNFYKIDDDGILYPLEKEPDIPTKEKRIYETKSKLDNIIENFFDTGKFVF